MFKLWDIIPPLPGVVVFFISGFTIIIPPLPGVVVYFISGFTIIIPPLPGVVVFFYFWIYYNNVTPTRGFRNFFIPKIYHFKSARSASSAPACWPRQAGSPFSTIQMNTFCFPMSTLPCPLSSPVSCVPCRAPRARLRALESGGTAHDLGQFCGNCSLTSTVIRDFEFFK